MLDRLRKRAEKLNEDISALVLALRDSRTPWYAKATAAVAVAYALSPVDIIPDFIPILGYLDDLILLPALISLTVRLVPGEVLDDCRRRAANAPGNGKRWYYALPIVAIWVVVVVLIVRAVWRCF